VKQFSSKSVDMSLRVASLDYLGIVAARLRKDAVSSQLNESIIDEIIQQVAASFSAILFSIYNNLLLLTKFVFTALESNSTLQKLVLLILAVCISPQINISRPVTQTVEN